MKDIFIDRQFTVSDAECLKRLRDFLPGRVFDAHTHLYRGQFLPNVSKTESTIFSDEEVGYPEFLTYQKLFFPEADDFRVHTFPMPDIAFADRGNGIREAYTDWTAAQMDKYPGRVFGSVMVMPGDTEEEIERLVQKHRGFVGLKCYLIYAPDGIHAAMDDFLPESAWAVADKLGLTITVHLGRLRALSDPDNMRQILDKTMRYPHVRLILAHSAHGFAAHTAAEALDRLRGRENIWFDVAAICEIPATWAILKTFGSSRLLWGTDFPISLLKGISVSCGNGFLWLSGERFRAVAENDAYADSVMYMTEQLTALRDVCRMAGLPRGEVERIFFDNANELFLYR